MTNGYVRKMKAIYTPSGFCCGGGGRDGAAKGAVVVTGSGNAMAGGGRDGVAIGAAGVTGSGIGDKHQNAQFIRAADESK